MKLYLSSSQRIFRGIFSIILLTWLIIGGPVWTIIGAYLLLTSSWGLCPVKNYYYKKKNSR